MQQTKKKRSALTATTKLYLVMFLAVAILAPLQLNRMLHRLYVVQQVGESSAAAWLPMMTGCENPSAANNNTSLSLFDQAARKAHQMAVSPPTKAAVRNKFNLSSWKQQTKGGLLDNDRTLLGKLYYNATSVFEFGLGESTYIAAATGVPRYAGVDSDPNWVSQARDKSNMPHFRFYLADIGKTGKWGYPVNQNLSKSIFQYQLSVLSAEEEPFDVYLIDGRYRVACGLISFLHAASRGGDMSKVRVVTHDNDRGDEKRRGYHGGLQKVGDVVAKSDKLLVYRQRNDTTEQDIYNLWEQYKNDVR